MVAADGNHVTAVTRVGTPDPLGVVAAASAAGLLGLQLRSRAEAGPIAEQMEPAWPQPSVTMSFWASKLAEIGRAHV